LWLIPSRLAKKLQIALVGNPNSGKSSLFNALTGLNQQVGNFPGVTVDKKSGSVWLDEYTKAELIDLPGTYALYPRRADEWVAYKVLLGADEGLKPDMLVLVADASNLKRNLLFCSQVLDLKLPTVIALTMNDLAATQGVKIDIAGLEAALGVPVITVNPRKNKGLTQLKKAVADIAKQEWKPRQNSFIDVNELAPQAIQLVQQWRPNLNQYQCIHYLVHHQDFGLPLADEQQLKTISNQTFFNTAKIQATEVVQRYQRIRQLMQQTVVEPAPLQRKLLTNKLDNILLHRIGGYLILLLVLFLLFQSIFWLAAWPMDGIEWGFAQLSGWLSQILPNTWWSNFIINGLVAGLSGILVFVPQIMILFGLITILEDSGYMARISFLTDRLMRKVGLNGKSVMPMISGLACAVPAIMSTRNIENRKERLLTILITPLMSCSARLPVYTILVALVVSDEYYLGFLSLQGLVMMGLYLLGLVMALLVSYVAKWFIRIQEKSFFILELPVYRSPRWKNAGITMVQKAKIFVLDAGKIIMLISILLWALSNFGPGNGMQKAAEPFAEAMAKNTHPDTLAQLQKQIDAAQLEHSYAGKLGQAIEPLIQPLGYDWKIGIALITSFAAREVFVGTMATLYSVGQEDDASLRQKMQTATHPNGLKVYTKATAFSLLIFYVLAMQCISTLAIVRKETRSLKWPIIQFVYMTLLAYACSWLTYTLFS
jgi:ferrous iron transport protein B